VQLIRIDPPGPTHHQIVYEALKHRVLPRPKHVEGYLHLNLSPGTPAMHSAWLILHAGRAFAPGKRLWPSQPNRLDAHAIRGQHLPRRGTWATVTRAERAFLQSRGTLGSTARGNELPISLCARKGAPLPVLEERGTGKSRLMETQVATLKQ